MQSNQIPKVAIGSLLLIGIAFLSYYLFGYYEISRAKTWTPVDAVVGHCWISSTPEIRETLSGNRTVYNNKLIFEFNYTVSGHQYASSTFSAWGQPSQHWIAKQYPVNEHFTALYNPKDPTDAVVEPGSVSRLLLVVSVVSFWLAALSIKYNRKRD